MQDTPVYFFNLDADYVIDASAQGSMARFINHSCDPNCHTEKWTVGGETRIAIVATNGIPKGTEVCVLACVCVCMCVYYFWGHV
jgi:SET domain-containing protein